MNTGEKRSLPPRRKYDVQITHHARERYVERILDPNRYSHLQRCRTDQCEQCSSLIREMRNTLNYFLRQIDGQIARRVRDAREKQSFVTDENFKAAIRKKYGQSRDFEFLQDDDGIYVLVKQPEDRPPALLTVMTHDMIDGTVFMVFGNDAQDMNRVFSCWKREIRHDSGK